MPQKPGARIAQRLLSEAYREVAEARGVDRLEIEDRTSRGRTALSEVFYPGALKVDRPDDQRMLAGVRHVLELASTEVPWGMLRPVAEAATKVKESGEKVTRTPVDLEDARLFVAVMEALCRRYAVHQYDMSEVIQTAFLEFAREVVSPG